VATNVYHRVRQADPFGPEVSPAIWLVPNRPTPKEVFQLTETLDVIVNDRPALASRQTSRLPAQKTERSLASRFEGLLSVSAVIGTHHDIEGLISALVTELFRVVDFDVIEMSRLEEATNRVDWHLYRSGGGIEHGTSDGTKEETLSAWICQRQKPLIIPFLDREILLHGRIKGLAEDGIRSLCAFPLTCAQQRIGCLVIGSKQPEAYSDDEVLFLSLIADMTASAIAGAMNFEALKKTQADLQGERDRLQLLLELNNQIVSNLELRTLLRTVSASVRRVMQCDAVGVYLPDAESKQLQLCALDFPEGNGLLKEDNVVLIEGCNCRNPAEVFRTRKPMLMSQLGSEPPCKSGACNNGTAHPREELESACALPLICHERVLGVLELGRRQGPVFTQADVDFLMQVANQIAIAIENALAYGEITDLKNKLSTENLYLEEEVRSEKGFEEIIGRSAAIRGVLRNIETVAPTASTVLICGETGTGKELVARAIHERSPRHGNAFVKLNCAAIPTGPLESELFGHEKGAFTGAIMQRTGRFEVANHGTAFLDEIAEISLELQPKLLRVLQEREFERLGSTRTLKTDARLIAATNRDLADCVEKQTFRADLYYRLNVFPIHVPPLRDRPEDIPLLVRHFMQYFARRMNRVIDTIPPETLEGLIRHSWPGNIRELQNLVEHSVILSSGPTLRVPLTGLQSSAPASHVGVKRRTMEEAEREHILATLKDTRWVVSGTRGAAARLGMNRSTLQFRMKRLGIVRPGT
jgi:formate hydrogenlyase transcriptional activator